MKTKLCRLSALLLCFALLLGLACSGIPASATVTQEEIDALEAQRDEIRDRQAGVQEQLSSLRSDRDSILARKAALDEQNDLLRQDIALLDEQIALYDTLVREKSAAVEQARLQTPDVIVALVHWGSEYDREIAESQEEIAKLLFDSGVHLIVGSHSHFVGPMEFRSHSITPYGGSFIAYSLGDFVSSADTSSARNGCVLSVSFLKDSDGVRISELSYAPTYSAAPSEDLELKSYEVLDTLDAISFYESGYYDRVSEKLYDRLVSAVEKMQEQTGLGEQQAGR